MTDIDYLLNCLTPFTMEQIFLITCDCNKRKIVSDDKAFGMIQYIIEESKSNRYKNKVNLILLIGNISKELFEKYHDYIITELKV